MFKMEFCISDIKSWMLLNMLKLNDSKTEFLEFHPSPHPRSTSTSPSSIGSDTIILCHTAKNLGVVFDSNLCLTERITATCKAANC